MSHLPHKAIDDVILDSISDGVFTVDRQWRITSFNHAAEKITGVSRADAVGQRCCDVFRASICEGRCALDETLRTGRSIVNKSIFIVNADGQRIPISISTAMLKDADEHVIGGVETFRDLTLVEELRKELHESYTFADIIGRSPAMRKIFDILPQIADSDSTVLIEGASGTGKELVARAIHNLSPRCDGAFVAVNCGALPDTLLESELFGYKAGAFTDARTDKPGRITLADGGTLFLDEIGDISQAMQIRLLRVLQERTIEPLGGVEPTRVNVRILAATNKNIDQLVRKGVLREDFYYRMNVIRLTLPLLRERREDIPLLAEHFVHKFNRLHSRDVAGLSGEALAVLMEHVYPGNVRELENIIEHAFVLCRGAIIEIAHLPGSLRVTRGNALTDGATGPTLEALDAMHIADALRRHDGNRKAAASELGIAPSTLFRKAKRLGVALPPQDGRSRKQ